MRRTLVAALLLAGAFLAGVTALPPARAERPPYRFQIYLVAVDEPGGVVLQAVDRQGPAGDSVVMARQAMQALCDGPLWSEGGLRTHIPAGCRVLGARLEEGGTLHLDLSRGWDQVGGMHGTAVFVEQIHATLSQWEDLRWVWFYTEGKKQEYYTLEGAEGPLALHQPQPDWLTIRRQ